MSDIYLMNEDRFRNVLFRGFHPCRFLVSVLYIKTKMENISCEIEDSVETDICKLRMILRSRVLWASYDLLNKIYTTKCSFRGEHNLTALDVWVIIIN